MWIPDSQTLESADERTAFIVLSWTEMFGRDTPDTFRPRLHDSSSLLAEIAEIVSLAEDEAKTLKQLALVRAELQAAASDDQVLKRHFPFVASAIRNLDKDYDLAGYASFARVATARIEGYDERAVEVLQEAVSRLMKAKADVLRAIGHLGSIAQRQGIPARECRTLFNSSMLAQPPDAAIDHIVRQVRLEERTWRCFAAIAGREGDIESLIHDTEFHRLEAKDKPRGRGGKEFADRAAGALALYADVSARSPSEAAHKALAPLRRLLDVANFFHRKGAFRLVPYVLVTCGREQYPRELDMRSQRGLRPTLAATERASEMHRSGSITALPDRILASLEQHAVAHASSDYRIRFTNLWVALETLVGKQEGTTGIAAVLRRVLPILLYRRINKIVRYLAINLHEAGLYKELEAEARTVWFPRSTEHEIRADELLLCLSGRHGEAAMSRLLSKVSKHPLLCFRLNKTYELLKSPKHVLESIRGSKQHTDWHIQRIYRARNALLHAGTTVSWLPQLLENLEYYYALTLDRVLQDFRRYAVWEPDASFENRRLSYEYLCRLLQEQPGSVTVDDLLAYEEDREPEQLVWPPAPSAP